MATFDIGDIENLVENYKTCVEAIRGAMGSTDVKFEFVDGENTITGLGSGALLLTKEADTRLTRCQPR